MGFYKEEFGEVYKKFRKDNPQFEEYIAIVRKYSEGRIWVIGGLLTRLLLGVNVTDGDIDFLADRPSREKLEDVVKKGWEIRQTDFNIYVERGNERLDLNYLSNFHSIVRRNLKPKISHFYTGTPFVTQAIALDIETGELTGKKAIEAIRKQTERINNFKEAKFEAERRNVTVAKLLKERADAFGLKLIRNKSYRRQTRSAHENSIHTI